MNDGARGSVAFKAQDLVKGVSTVRFVVRRARSSVSVFPLSIAIENVGHSSWVGGNLYATDGYLEKAQLRAL